MMTTASATSLRSAALLLLLTGVAWAQHDSARAGPETLAPGAFILARFATPREVVVLMDGGGTVALSQVASVAGQVVAVSERGVIRLRVIVAYAAAGSELSESHSGGTAFLVPDSATTLSVTTTPAVPARSRRRGVVEVVVGGLVPVVAFLLILRRGRVGL